MAQRGCHADAAFFAGTDKVVVPLRHSLFIATRIRGGEVSPAGVVRVNFYPNGSTSGLDVVIDDRDTPADQGFVVSLDPLIGVVTIQDEPQR